MIQFSNPVNCLGDPYDIGTGVIASFIFIIMDSLPLNHYLRMYRRQSGLTQVELAHLLGCRFGERVSKYERTEGNLSAAVSLSYSIIFNLPIDERYTCDLSEIKRGIFGRARLLAIKFSMSPASPRREHNLSFLKQLTNRIGTNE